RRPGAPAGGQLPARGRLPRSRAEPGRRGRARRVLARRPRSCARAVRKPRIPRRAARGGDRGWQGLSRRIRTSSGRDRAHFLRRRRDGVLLAACGGQERHVPQRTRPGSAPVVARSHHHRQEAVRQPAEQPAPARSEWVVPALGAVFLLSGGAGLVHEVVWARLLGHVFGATSLAVATVLAAFMGGLAIGSWWMGRRPPMADRRRLYAFLEVGIGLSALVLPFLLGLVEPFYAWIWREFQFSFAVFSVLRFFLAGALLLPPTIMMGATLPALADYLAGLRGRRIGAEWLYTLNLAGAALGAAAA